MLEVTALKSDSDVLTLQSQIENFVTKKTIDQITDDVKGIRVEVIQSKNKVFNLEDSMSQSIKAIQKRNKDKNALASSNEATPK